jgi:DNA-binding GntR family transcriptional regulator
MQSVNVKRPDGTGPGPIAPQDVCEGARSIVTIPAVSAARAVSHGESMSTLGGLQIRNLQNATERFTAHEIVRETLRHAILSGDLPGGTRLVQAELAVQLKVSTTPVREALRDLASEKLIRFHPHRGAVVHELDMDELTEVYEIRKALEPLAMRLAATHITKAQLKEAAALHARMEKERDPGAWVETNWKFHSLLENAAQSPRLSGFVKSVQDSSALYVAHAVHLEPGLMRKGNADHRGILAALRAGDGDLAAETLRRHLDTTLHAILTANTSAEGARTLKKRGSTGRARRPSG